MKSKAQILVENIRKASKSGKYGRRRSPIMESTKASSQIKPFEDAVKFILTRLDVAPEGMEDLTVPQMMKTDEIKEFIANNRKKYETLMKDGVPLKALVGAMTYDDYDDTWEEWLMNTFNVDVNDPAEIDRDPGSMGGVKASDVYPNAECYYEILDDWYEIVPY